LGLGILIYRQSKQNQPEKCWRKHHEISQVAFGEKLAPKGKIKKNIAIAGESDAHPLHGKTILRDSSITSL
jgi:hypothetical protein